MNLQDKFEDGITAEAYISTLKKHRDGFMKIYNNFTLPTEDEDFLKNRADFRIMVIAEEWCGHCMLNIAILLKMNEKIKAPIRFFPRDQHLDLMDNYLINEKRYIPIFIFIDEAGNELTHWGPRAPEVTDYVEQLKKSLPEQGTATYDEAFQSLIETVANTFENDRTFWNYVYQDLKKALPSKQ